MKTLEELIKDLPPELQEEVRDFVEFLLRRQEMQGPARRLSLDWAGGLSELRDQYTSIELQKKALEWRKL